MGSLVGWCMCCCNDFSSDYTELLGKVCARNYVRKWSKVMYKVIMLFQLLFFISFGLTYGELVKNAKEDGKITTLISLPLDTLQNVKLESI